MTEFVPKVGRLFGVCDLVQILELFSDQLPLTPLLQFYSFPNVLDYLPKRMNGLTVLYIATTLSQLYVTLHCV